MQYTWYSDSIEFWKTATYFQLELQGQNDYYTLITIRTILTDTASKCLK